MDFRFPNRLKHIAGIGADRVGSRADESGKDFQRLENIRFVFANEPVERLMSLGRRVRSALER
jgi:N-succinyldiaminopimelate aminotransferase